jgi:hypothetical protein
MIRYELTERRFPHSESQKKITEVQEGYCT